MLDDEDDRFIPDPKVQERYSVNSDVIRRWDQNEALGFPKAYVINNRKYRKLSELRAFELRCARGGATFHGQRPDRGHPRPGRNRASA